MVQTSDRDFMALCEACHARPDDPEPNGRFDALYGAAIEDEVRLLFRGRPEHIKLAAKAATRRFVIAEGRVGRSDPEALIRTWARSLVAPLQSRDRSR